MVRIAKTNWGRVAGTAVSFTCMFNSIFYEQSVMTDSSFIFSSSVSASPTVGVEGSPGGERPGRHCVVVIRVLRVAWAWCQAFWSRSGNRRLIPRVPPRYVVVGTAPDHGATAAPFCSKTANKLTFPREVAV
jgi:hypothetical protein